MFSLISIFTLLSAHLACVTGQTFSACNPLHEANCPPNAALGKTINVDFTKGSVESFSPSGNPTYDADGVHFTVAKPGDAPQLNSIFYIMFGKVSITMKTAPGAGIVSSVVLQSDILDEIDIEWIGARDSEVQTNYFGKGDTTSYDRGATSPTSNHEQQFITYSIEWTSSQIVWSVDNKVVRVLTPATAATNQYPQTPMQVKFGAWSGGDPANSPGTIQWANGPTDYSKGPFTMTVKSISVSDYSNGSQYKYGDNSGSWGSIIAVGGGINSNAGKTANRVVTAEVPSITSPSPVIPVGLGKNHDSSSTMTVWPWVATTTQSSINHVATSVEGLPSGWVITSSGKVVPANSAAPPHLVSSPSYSSSPLSSDLDSVNDSHTQQNDYGSSLVTPDSKDPLSTINETQNKPTNLDSIVETCNNVECKNDNGMNDTSTSSAVKSLRSLIWLRILTSGLVTFLLGFLLI
ncbi:putative extracellular glycosidase [Golovinomyces cichoracearum]|uniref:Crh-like protein n=1 Tax=Golovinomyces cichoracearum TaxID=62708 RepID=A0A420IBZ8_9PEZI|nr:putative extracellular glycosidase [Golovinomyces cichoracearum]